MDNNKLYELWKENAIEDMDLIDELESINGNDSEISDRFYRELEFGTGGLRGVIGAGTNRMNIYTIAKATQGLADYVNSIAKNGSVAIAYDSRIKSDIFARTAAGVFAANGIKVYIYDELMPTPMLSFAVRRLSCDAGIVVTASHNPSIYNGYKVYGSDGCQMTLEASTKVLSYINKTDTFTGVKRMSFKEAMNSAKVSYIDQVVIDEYLDNVQAQSLSKDICAKSDMSVIYTPLHGSGNKPVRAILKRIGIKQVTIVPQQELPDGNFPTASYPNPEIRKSFECALDLAKTVKPDLLLATDPDCDRVGIAVKSGDDFILMSGNEVGALLLNYILSRRAELGIMPKNPVAIKTIVTTNICENIAKKYNCKLLNVLTGFKYIGEQIGVLEQKHQDDRYVFGFEESYGYLAGSYVRDKDAVVGSMLICEMACFYKAQGKTLLDVYNEVEQEFGVFINSQTSFTCEGELGMQQMNDIMARFRSHPIKEIAGIAVSVFEDYEVSKKVCFDSGNIEQIMLPKSNVLSYTLAGGSSVIVRPSGTEPKIKVYISAVSDNKASAVELDKKLAASISEKIGL